MTDRLARELTEEFVERGYKWSIDGVLRPPTLQTMKDLLEKADKEMQDESLLEVGRLILVKRHGHLDIFIYRGDYYDD